MLLAAATLITLAGWSGIAQATNYCTYFIISGFFGLNPALGAGEIICVDCPASNTCPGPSGTVFTATLRDGSGNESAGRLRKIDDNCVPCPTDGKTGYTFVKVPKVSLVEDDIDWTTNAGLVRFHLRFRNTDLSESSLQSDFQVFVQDAYGAHVPNGQMIHQGTVAPMGPDSFFDVFFDVPLASLPPNPAVSFGTAPADGASLNDPCAPEPAWHGNIDVVWMGPGGDGQVNMHTAGLPLFPGGATKYVHLLTGCGGPITWSFGPACAGFTFSLVNEDYTPAPAALPPGWTGWISANAAVSVPGGTQCCFTLDMVCEYEPAQIRLCARACSEPTNVVRKRWAEVKAFYR
jgi:hypothetical protein